MASSFIPDDFKKKIKKQLDKIEIFKRILSDAEIEARIGKFLEFEKNPDNAEKIFNDGTRDWIFLQSPEMEVGVKKGKKVALNAPREVESEFSDDNRLWICKFKLGQISVFGTKEQFIEMGFGNIVIITGRLKAQYKLIGTQEFHSSLEAMCKAYNREVDDLTEEDFLVTYSINIYQVIK
ncbi:MAG: hypothetical protein ACTSQJ_00395 [Promethearchaeota archaeon]